jgi:hypothetical protein
MPLRLLSSLAAATLLVYFAGSLLGAEIAPPQPKIIATVVAHAHEAHWVAARYAHGL